MDFQLDPKVHYQAGKEALRLHSREANRLTAVYAAMILGLNLVFLLLTVLGIQRTDTLSGFAAAEAGAKLEALSSLLTYGANVCLPVLTGGLVIGFLRIRRNQGTSFRVLGEGFRHFIHYFVFSVMFYLHALLIFMGIGILSVFCMGFYLNAFVPQSFVEQVAASGVLDLAQVLHYTWPLLVFLSLLVLAAILPVVYRFRMVYFLQADFGTKPSMELLTHAARMTKGFRWQLFLLDLRYWWYFVLSIAFSFLPMLELFCPELPILSEFPWLYSLLSVLLTAILSIVGLPRVAFSMASAYEALLDRYQKQPMLIQS